MSCMYMPSLWILHLIFFLSYNCNIVTYLLKQDVNTYEEYQRELTFSAKTLMCP